MLEQALEALENDGMPLEAEQNTLAFAQWAEGEFAGNRSGSLHNWAV